MVIILPFCRGRLYKARIPLFSYTPAICANIAAVNLTKANDMGKGCVKVK